STGDGPRSLNGGRAVGFARTPLGALLAAVHIAVRANPQWGPKVFEPTIGDQVIGPDAEALLASTREAYDRLRGDRPDGAELGRGYVALEGFRWLAYLERPGFGGGPDTWKGEGLWHPRGSTPQSCVNARSGWCLSCVNRPV